MQIKDHILIGENVKKMVPSSNHSGEFEKGNLDTIIVHYTAGPYQPSLNTLTNPKVQASAHVLVDRDGSITQMIPFNLIAWHAGESAYGGRIGFNKYSIGIEIVNSGPLTKSGNVFRSWFGAAYNPSDVIEAVHRNQTKPQFWHIYTEEQIQSIFDLCRLLTDAYGMKNILGHEEIAPKRKTDPGPAFPLDRLRNQVLGGSRNQDGPENLPDSGRVSVETLNIRSIPGANGELVAKPLLKGTKVRIIEENNGWFKVGVEVEGWVFGKYIEH